MKEISMKKIIFNGSSLTGKEQYGVQRFMKELLYELDKIMEPGLAEVMVPEDGINSLLLSNIEIIPISKSLKKWDIFLWNQFGFRKYTKSQNAYAVDLALTLPVTGCDVAAIHDCIRESFPENADSCIKKISRKFYAFRVQRNLRTCKFIISVSEYSREDIARIYNYNKNNIFIVPNAWQHFNRIESDPTVLEKYNLTKGGFFFSLGSRYAHKNFKWVAEAAKQNPTQLFIVSGSNILSSSDAELNQKKPDNLIFTGYLQDGEIKALMANCKAFIQPSLYEGFGIPPMEAMSVGADCIVSNVSSLPEIYKDSVWYIDPSNYENIDLNEIMSRPKQPAQQILDAYSWKKSAEILKELLLNKLE